MPPQIISEWAIDTGCTRHMTGFIEDFWKIGPSAPGDIITIAGGTVLQADGVGSVRLYCALPNGKTVPYDMTGVIFSRALNRTRLFSYSTVRNSGLDLKAKGTELFLLHSESQKPALWARWKLGLYYIQAYNISRAAPHQAFLSFPLRHKTQNRKAASKSARLDDDPSSAPKMIVTSKDELPPEELDELLRSATFVYMDKAIFIEDLMESEETAHQQRLGMEALQHLTSGIQKQDDNEMGGSSDSSHSSLSVQGSETLESRFADIERPGSPSLVLATESTARVSRRSPSPYRGPISPMHPRISAQQKIECEEQYWNPEERTATKSTHEDDDLGGMNFWT